MCMDWWLGRVWEHTCDQDDLVFDIGEGLGADVEFHCGVDDCIRMIDAK